MLLLRLNIILFRMVLIPPQLRNTRFSQAHGFQKPNDMDALLLMNAAAMTVVEDMADIVFSYGVSDEYSFVLRKTSTLYQRRASKLVSVICSLFASSYIMNGSKVFPNTALQCVPAFDGRAVCYPSESILRDYLSWRQVDYDGHNYFDLHLQHFHTCAGKVTKLLCI